MTKFSDTVLYRVDRLYSDILPEQTVLILIKLLLKEQSDQDLHCLLTV